MSWLSPQHNLELFGGLLQPNEDPRSPQLAGIEQVGAVELDGLLPLLEETHIGVQLLDVTVGHMVLMEVGAFKVCNGPSDLCMDILDYEQVLLHDHLEGTHIVAGHGEAFQVTVLLEVHSVRLRKVGVEQP